jgi:hypothetical protein
MARHLQEHFDQAFADDPGVAPDELARAAITEGDALRRRRRRLTAAAGVILSISAATGLNALLTAPDAADPPITVAAAMMPVAAPSCTQKPVPSDATDAIVFLRPEVTDRQRAALDVALRADPRLGAVEYQSHQQAFERFQALWADNPDLVDAVSPAQLPEEFRVRLTAASLFVEVRAQYASMDGVEQIIGRRCSPEAPVGGVL